jgi:drug/metabolite transporter (DMT)-like permease
LEDLDPFTLVAIRTGIGATGLWTIIALTKRRFPLDTRTLLGFLILGAFNTAIPFVLITWGEQFIASGVAGVLNATVPLFTLVIAHFALSDERINRLRLVGLVVGFTGVVVIFSNDLLAGLAQMREGAALGQAFGNVQGQLAVVAASICYAAAITFARRNMHHVEPLVVSGGSQIVAFTLVAISALLFENPLASQISGRSWFAVGWLGLLGTCLAYILYYFIITQMGATRASLVTYLLPIVAFTLGAIVLDEAVTWQLFVGGLLIIGGIALVNRQTAQPEADAPRAEPALEATS